MTTTTTKRVRTPEEQELLDMVRRYEALMCVRIGVGNRLKAMQRQGLIDDQHPAFQLLDELERGFIKIESSHERAATKMVRDMPIFKEWLSLVPGVSNTGAQLIAHLRPISDFPNVAKLWAYAGLHVIDVKAARRVAGQRSNWNPALKTLCYRVAANFVRTKGYYRGVYDRIKARERVRHPEPVKTSKLDRHGKPIVEFTDGHIHNRAMRTTVKLFLSHLWEAWRTMEGLPVRPPYPMEYAAHTGYISPWEVVDVPRPELVET